MEHSRIIQTDSVELVNFEVRWHMKTYLIAPLVTLFLSLFVLQACSTTQNRTSYSDDREKVMRMDGVEIISDVRINPNGTLADHLRRIPGVDAGDSHVQIRGPKSIARGGSDGPLFVINTVPVGDNFSQVQSLVHMENVRAINVYRGGEGHRRFGPRAAYGLVEITTY